LGQPVWQRFVDGASVTVTGPRQLASSCRLAARLQPQGAGLRLELVGALNVVFLIEASSDLVNWTPLTVLTNTLGRVEFVDRPCRLSAALLSCSTESLNTTRTMGANLPNP